MKTAFKDKKQLIHLRMEAQLKSIIPNFIPENLRFLQNLWADYGKLYYYRDQQGSYIIKHYHWQDLPQPKTEEEKFARSRKLFSFENELNWYKTPPFTAHYNPYPKPIYCEKGDQELLLILEDLTTQGFLVNRPGISEQEIRSSIKYLANFHAAGLSASPEKKDLGGYWHLETRPHEWQKMQDGFLKQQAHKIHQTICKAKHTTLLHGDAKPANYAYHPQTEKIVGFDFQYWGKGIGSQDVACYLFGVASDQSEWKQYTDQYFSALKRALHGSEKKDVIITEWETLFPLCRADYYRFLLGWNPNHSKCDNYDLNWDREAILKLV